MNTGFVRPAVATVLTACGIETVSNFLNDDNLLSRQLQQYLPLAVLKRFYNLTGEDALRGEVATVLTACGIETVMDVRKIYVKHFWLQQYLPLAVLKLNSIRSIMFRIKSCNSTYRLRY